MMADFSDAELVVWPTPRAPSRVSGRKPRADSRCWSAASLEVAENPTRLITGHFIRLARGLLETWIVAKAYARRAARGTRA